MKTPALALRAFPAILASAAVLLVSAPTASSTAAPLSGDAVVAPMGTESCSFGRICRWSGSNYTGAMSTASATGTIINVTGTWKSLYVNRSGAVAFYPSPGGSGTPVCFGPGRTAPSLSGWQTTPGSIKLLASGCP